MRRTKIVCTIGPAVEDEDMLRALVKEGMNVARINFSHGSHEEHKQKFDRIKKVRQELNEPVAILLDTKGPEIRTGLFKNGGADLVNGSQVKIYSQPIEGDAGQFSVSYPDFYADVSPGKRILIDDGLLELVVDKIENKVVTCTVRNGGHVSDRKGVNLPGSHVKFPVLTEQDKLDIEFGIQQGIDFIAASFVRRAVDVLEIRKLLDKLGGEKIHIIAKIENEEGVRNFDEILKVADGIMVARGDLGVEIPIENVPSVQKQLIRKCYLYGKPCITATHMLDSMIRNPLPTRAEVSDVANAILDGTSAVMLSGETAAGKFPISAIQTMAKIAETTEKSVNYWHEFAKNRYDMQPNVANAISHACCTTAMDLKASAIVVVTFSGRTARLMSRFRPECPIIATTVSARSQRQLNLSWGVRPYLVDEIKNTDEIFEMAMNTALDSGSVAKGDVVVMAGGTPIGMSGTTNILKVETVGHHLAKGKSLGKGTICGEALVYKTGETSNKSYPDTEKRPYILIADQTDNSMMPLIREAAAVVVEDPDPASHTTVACLALDIPLLYGTENITKLTRDGSPITVDLELAIVY